MASQDAISQYEKQILELRHTVHEFKRFRRRLAQRPINWKEAIAEVNAHIADLEDEIGDLSRMIVALEAT